MLPILLDIGPVKIYSYGIFLSLGLLIGLYYFWKMGRDEHLDEISLFDSFFISLLTYFIVGRVFFLIEKNQLYSNIMSSISILSHPGLSTFAGIVGSLIVLKLIIKVKGWETWKVMDFAAVSYAVIFIFGSIGSLLNGTNVGRYVSSSIDLLSTIYSVIMFVVIYRIRKNFRFYSWYKGESSVSKDGLATLSFILMVSLYYVMRFFLESNYYYVMLVTALLGVFLALFAIYTRSGRKIKFFSGVQLLKKGGRS